MACILLRMPKVSYELFWLGGLHSGINLGNLWVKAKIFCVNRIQDSAGGQIKTSVLFLFIIQRTTRTVDLHYVNSAEI
jgi:hypothetical protein